jgi:hypothetical protein
MRVDAARQQIVRSFAAFDVHASALSGNRTFLSDGLVVVILAQQELTLTRKDDPAAQFTILLMIEEESQIVREIRLIAGNAVPLPTMLDLSALFEPPRCQIQNPRRGNTSLTALFGSSTGMDAQLSARLLSRGYGWWQPVYEIRLGSFAPDQCEQWTGFIDLTRHQPARR